MTRISPGQCLLPTIVIATRFDIAIPTAIAASILCINRRLYMLASPITAIPSQADKNREVIIDLAIGIGLPIIVVALGLSFNLFLRLLLIHIQSISIKILDLQLLKTTGVVPQSSFPGFHSFLRISYQSFWKLWLEFTGV